MINEPIRVLQVTGIMNRGGAETMIMNLYRNIDRKKIQFDFVENSLEPGVFDEEIKSLGGKIYYCPHFNMKNILAYKKWWKKFFLENHAKYLIVHGHIGSTAAIYLQVAKKWGIYTIAHSHSSGTDHSVKDLLYRILSYNTRNIADYFFACSQAAGVDRFGKKVISDPSQYHVLNNAIDTIKFQYNREIRRRVRQQLNLGDSDILIGHVGRFTAEKNHRFILDIFESILSARENSFLILVGNGPLKNVIEKKVEELGIQKKVSFLGVRSDVNELMQAMDVLVFPSIYEGLPVTLVEAQAAGLPCVISDRVPKDSIITTNLISVKSLSDSKEEWAKHILSRKGERRVDHMDEVVKSGFDIKECAKYLEEFYLEKIKK